MNASVLSWPKSVVEGKSILEKGEKWKLIIEVRKVTSDAKGAPKDAALDLSKILDPAKEPLPLIHLARKLLVE
jgi:hypothetical protein